MKSLTQIESAWKEIFGDSGVSLDELKQRGLKGKISEDSLRSLHWKIYLEYLPSLETNAWPSVLQKERHGYEDLKKRFAFDPSRGATKELEVNNPLSLDDESPWSQYFKDTELVKIIRQDVERTMPDQPFFREERIQEILTSILFVWSKLNPDVSYRQGMHEILAPILYVVEMDKVDARQNGLQFSLQAAVFDDKFVEHDTAVLFYKIMRSAKPLYETGNDVESKPARSTRGGRLGDSQARVLPIVAYCKRIQNDLLRVLDVELCDHLIRLGIEPQLYGLRWLRLLFGREFALHEVLTLWDGLFADDPNLGLIDWVCIALLIFMRRDLLSSDFASALHRLMKFPPMESLNTTIPEFISSAKGCRDRYGQIALAAAKTAQAVDNEPLSLKKEPPRQISSSSINSIGSASERGQEHTTKSPSMVEASADPYAAKVALLESRVATQWREAQKVKERDRQLNKKIESTLALMKDVLNALRIDGSIDGSRIPELEGVIDELSAVASELSGREKQVSAWSNQAGNDRDKETEALKTSPLEVPSSGILPIKTNLVSAVKPLNRVRSDADRAAAASLFNSSSTSALGSQPARPPILAVPEVDITATMRAASGSVRKIFSDLSTAVMTSAQTATSPSNSATTRFPSEDIGQDYREHASIDRLSAPRRAFPPPALSSTPATNDPLGSISR
ncbi:rab-GTPase-TBC domain-containing protein [Chytridium lagenaria]|nr:rab-GTPase-TBC domain-containing protein [Chytridium lagenaria]